MFSFYFNKLSGVKQQILFMILLIRNSGRVQLGGFFPPCGRSWALSSGCKQIAAEPGVAEITLPYPYILSSVFNSLDIYLAEQQQK